MQSKDKRSPFKSKRVGIKKALWINEHLRREMHKRDFLKTQYCPLHIARLRSLAAIFLMLKNRKISVGRWNPFASLMLLL